VVTLSRMRYRIIVPLACFAYAYVVLLSGQSLPTGIPDIDRIRTEISSKPTDISNLRERHSMLYAWFRFLMAQGVDLSAFEDVRSRIREGEPTVEVFRAIDEGYALLERIHANPIFIREKHGRPELARGARAPTDWPMYNGGPSQTGYSPDPGPATGEIAWRFPIGHSWYARPAVENGRVYTASPGMTTLALCLDEKTGAILWRARQYGHKLYSTPRAASGVVVLKDYIVVRATTGSWEEEPPRHLYWIDKATGRTLRREDSGMVDYRRGYPPLTGDQRYLAYAYSKLDLRGMPATASMLDTVVIRESNSGRLWWTFRVGDLFGDPVISGDQVFAATDGGTLYALALTGAERLNWRFEARSPLRGTPVADSERVYVAAQDGTVHALRRDTGKRVWSFRTQELEPRAFQQFSTPAIANGRLYIGSAAKILYCIHTATGKLLWKQAVSDWLRARPLVVGRTVYAAAMDGTVWAMEDAGDHAKVLWKSRPGQHQILADLAGSERGILISSSDLWLYSLDPATGKTQWKQSLIDGAWIGSEFIRSDRIAGGSDYQSPPTAVGSRVFIGAPNRFVYAVDAATGKEIWRFETSGQVSGSPTVAEGRVYFGQQGGNKELYAVSEKDGALLWKQKVGWVWVTTTYSEGRLFTGTVEGDILSLNASDGKIYWTHRTNGGVYPSPATDEHRVYTGSWDSYYYALDKLTGKLEWAFARPGYRGGNPDSAAPILFNGNLLVRIAPVALAALNAKTGKLVWEFPGPKMSHMNATAAAHGDRIFTSAYTDLSGAPLGARLFALDLAGHKVWEYRGAGGWTGAVVTDNKVCAGSSTEPFFVCLDPKGNGDGTTNVIWRRKVGDIFEESVPAIYGDKLFVLCSDHYLYAFR